MKINSLINKKAIQVMLLSFLVSCGSPGNKNSNEKKETKKMDMGTYGYDQAFLKDNNVETVELKLEDSPARVLITPGYQGRVMTSSANGAEGTSFGWINYDLIKSGEILKHINPVGGEERIWFGPEGGPFSIYFEQGEEQVYENWNVPPVIDTESYDIKEKEKNSVTFSKISELVNASGTEFKLDIERKITLLSREVAGSELGVDLSSDSLDVVTYQSDNSIKNLGNNAWVKESGLLSIWLLCMFNPSPSITVFIPYNTEAEGIIVNDDYFGKVPSERLIVDKDTGTIFFKIDGKYRSKIGLPPERAMGLSGSYDKEKQVLTIVRASMAADDKDYVNSKWGDQDDPYDGDAINSYNDGPVEDGSIMGPFYEIETSSPGADLKPGESITHTQRVIHIQGDESKISPIVKKLFDLDLNYITTKFQ